MTARYAKLRDSFNSFLSKFTVMMNFLVIEILIDRFGDFDSYFAEYNMTCRIQ